MEKNMYKGEISIPPNTWGIFLKKESKGTRISERN